MPRTTQAPVPPTRTHPTSPSLTHSGVNHSGYPRWLTPERMIGLLRRHLDAHLGPLERSLRLVVVGIGPQVGLGPFMGPSRPFCIDVIRCLCDVRQEDDRVTGDFDEPAVHREPLLCVVDRGDLHAP